jgi:hypothetical protein
VAAALLASSCSVRGLDFKKDERIEIVSPSDREKVALPVTVSWTARDFDVTGRDGAAHEDAGYFGIYVDRSPQPPSETQDWVARDDAQCKRTPGCPDAAYLATRDVHTTTGTSFEIPRLPLPTETAQRRREFHEVTIVLLNGKGERIGESAFTVQFEVDREAR